MSKRRMEAFDAILRAVQEKKAMRTSDLLSTMRYEQLYAHAYTKECLSDLVPHGDLVTDDSQEFVAISREELEKLEGETLRSDIDAILGTTKPQRVRSDVILALVGEFGESSEEELVPIQKIVEAAKARGTEEEFVEIQYVD